MTTVDDIIRAMRERPDVRDQIRRAVLTDELLELPDRFATLGVRVDDIAVQTAANTKAIAELSAQTAANTKAIAELSVQTAANTKAIEALTVRVDDLAVRLDELTMRVDTLTETVGQLSESVKRIIDGVGSLMGERLERRLLRLGPPRISKALKLRRARIMHSPEVYTHHAEYFWDSVEMAEESDMITEDALDRFMNTDLIMRARRRTGERQMLWIAVEASLTIRQKDITRAADSADALRAAFDEDAAGVVMGRRIRDEDWERADEKGVTVILVDADYLKED